MQQILLTFLLLFIAGEVYTYILVRSLLKPVNKKWKKAVFATYILLSLLAWFSLISIRTFLITDISPLLRNILLAFALGMMAAKVLVAFFMLLDDMRRMLLRIVSRFSPAVKSRVTTADNHIPRSVFLKRMALFTGGLLLGGFMYGLRNRYNYQLQKIKLSFKNLPASFQGLKIVHISDIHSGSFDDIDSVARGVELVLEQKPDIIFFTGDLVNNSSDEFYPYIDLFSRLKAPMGVYSTLGNHDYGDYISWESPMAKKANLELLKRMHAQMNWKLMMNEHVVLQRGEDSIALIGVENWGDRARFPKYGDLHKACHGLEEKNIPFRMLLSHDPSHWDKMVIKEFKNIDLTFSGHTHGMQMGIEIPGFKWSPAQYLYKNWAGLARENDQYLYVNRGFGFLGYPGRLGIMPEITVIELKSV